VTTAAATLFRPNSFARRAGTLFGSTALGQAVTILAAPVITRIYEPHDMGALAVFLSVAMILTAVSTGQYQSAIVLPESDDDGFALLVGCGILALATSAVVLLGSLVEAAFSGRALIVGVALAFYVLALGVNDAVSHWLMRRSRYRVLATTRLSIVLLSTAVTLILGWLGYRKAGLIAGAVAGQLVATVVIAAWVWTQAEGSRRASRERTRSVLLRYRRFPAYSLPAELVNSLTNQLPVLLVTRFFGTYVSGLFSLTQRLLGMPLVLAARAILDVFKQRASRDYVERGNCADIYRKTFLLLCALGVPAFAFVAAFAPWLFAFVFGEKWRVSGEYARILAPMFLLRFVVGPLSYVLYIAERQGLDLILQLLLLTATGLSLTVGLAFGSAKIGLMAFSAAYSALYLVYLTVSWQLARGRA
jgi:O-antigen/teichoic acid export membrane protein